VPLTGPLVADVSLPFRHHVVLDGMDDVGPTAQRARTLETMDRPFADALAALTHALTSSGSTTTDDQTRAARAYRVQTMSVPHGLACVALYCAGTVAAE
jgi:hypothetical protein